MYLLIKHHKSFVKLYQKLHVSVERIFFTIENTWINKYNRMVVGPIKTESCIKLNFDLSFKFV